MVRFNRSQRAGRRRTEKKEPKTASDVKSTLSLMIALLALILSWLAFYEEHASLPDQELYMHVEYWYSTSPDPIESGGTSISGHLKGSLVNTGEKPLVVGAVRLNTRWTSDTKKQVSDRLFDFEKDINCNGATEGKTLRPGESLDIDIRCRRSIDPDYASVGDFMFWDFKANVFVVEPYKGRRTVVSLRAQNSSFESRKVAGVYGGAASGGRDIQFRINDFDGGWQYVDLSVGRLTESAPSRLSQQQTPSSYSSDFH